MSVNREFKDSMLRAIFKKPEKALELYCAITGKEYKPGTKVEVKTLESVLLSKLRNDLAFIVDNILVVIMEFQSSLNLNMPFRSLQYVVLLYELYYKFKDALYKEKRIMTPKPEFYVLYDGKYPYPESSVMRLSDSFIGLEKGEVPDLELTVHVLNINDGAKVLEKNADLKGYARFVSKVRHHLSEGETLAYAVHSAANECLKEGILTEFLREHWNEVEEMFSLMYDEEEAIRVAREEAGEEKEIEIAERSLKIGFTVEQVVQITGLSEEEVMKIKEHLEI